MRSIRAVCFASFLLFSIAAAAAVVKNPFDVTGMSREEAETHFRSMVGGSFEVTGVIRDFGDLKTSSITYEIPAYGMDGAGYVKYGVVCQLAGESKVIIADEGYLSAYVKKNVEDRPVLATGRFIEGNKVESLPKGFVFVIDSLRLMNQPGE